MLSNIINKRIEYYSVVLALILFSNSTTTFTDPMLLLIITSLYFGVSMYFRKPNYKLFVVLGIFIFHSILLYLRFNSFLLQFTIKNICYVLIAFSVASITRVKFIYYSEKAIVILSKISLFFFFIEILNINFLYKFIRAIQNFFLIKIDELYASSIDFYSTILIYTINHTSSGLFSYRNSGFTFEPGAFACFLLIGILFNLLLNKFKLNKNLYILIITLFSTQSTTGLIGLILLYVFYLFQTQKFNFSKIILPVLLIAVLFFYSNFGLPKLQQILTTDFNIDYAIERATDYDKFVSLGRFGGLLYTWQYEIPHSPYFGLGTLLMENELLGTASGIAVFIRTFGIIGFLILLFTFLKSAIFYTLLARRKAGYLLIFLLFIVMIFSFGIQSLIFFWIVLLMFYFTNKEKLYKTI